MIWLMLQQFISNLFFPIRIPTSLRKCAFQFEQRNLKTGTFCYSDGYVGIFVLWGNNDFFGRLLLFLNVK